MSRTERLRFVVLAPSFTTHSWFCGTFPHMWNTPWPAGRVVLDGVKVTASKATTRSFPRSPTNTRLFAGEKTVYIGSAALVPDGMATVVTWLVATSITEMDPTPRLPTTTPPRLEEI